MFQLTSTYSSLPLKFLKVLTNKESIIGKHVILRDLFNDLLSFLGPLQSAGTCVRKLGVPTERVEGCSQCFDRITDLV